MLYAFAVILFGVPDVLTIYFIFGYMKYFILYLLFPSLMFCQWTYRVSSIDDMQIAEAEILTDTQYEFEFLLFNNKYIGVNFSINSKYFKIYF